MIMVDSLERFIEVQLHEWGHRDGKPKAERAGPVIAITREPGSRGEIIAKKIAEEFGLVLYDWKIVEEIAKDSHVSERVVATLEENFRSELDDFLEGFSAKPGLSAHQYMQSLRKILFTVATHGNAVILGRGASFLLPQERRTLGLRFVAPLEVRVKNTMQALKLSHESALKEVTRTEKEQSQWVRTNCAARIDDASNYHMVINTALVTSDKVLQIVRSILEEQNAHAGIS
jgi:cytidylate kinase